jgi:hypothetical protein
MTITHDQETTKQHYGKVMAEGLFKTSEGLKSTLKAMSEFKSIYTAELQDKLKGNLTTEERIKLENELAEMNKPEVKSGEMMIQQIDTAMSRLNDALMSAFKIKK